MEMKLLLDISAKTLDRILSFFPRVDSKAPIILGADIGMLALLALNLPAKDAIDWYMTFAVIPIILLSVSLWHLYRSQFPDLDGGHDSLVYFSEIAKRTEANYIDLFLKQSNESHARDLIGQVWRNSQILHEKYNSIKNSLIFLGWAIPAWLISLGMFVLKNSSIAIM